jgi:hypothetical protein
MFLGATSTSFHSSKKSRQVDHTVIEPIPETVEAMLYQILGGTKIEPGIDYGKGESWR